MGKIERKVSNWKTSVEDSLPEEYIGTCKRSETIMEKKVGKHKTMWPKWITVSLPRYRTLKETARTINLRENVNIYLYVYKLFLLGPRNEWSKEEWKCIYIEMKVWEKYLAKDAGDDRFWMLVRSQAYVCSWIIEGVEKFSWNIKILEKWGKAVIIGHSHRY